MGYLDPGSGSLLVQLILVPIIVISVVCGTISAIIMKNKGRSIIGGIALGVLLGVIGLIIVITLPKTNESVQQQLLVDGHLKQCPYCRKVIDAQASICPYCRSQLSL